MTTCNTPGCAPQGAPAAATITTVQATGIVQSAVITIDTTKVTNPTDILRAMLHEIGHTMGLKEIQGDPNQANCGFTQGGSVMIGACNGSLANIATFVTDCDKSTVSANPIYPPPPPPTPCPSGACTIPPDYCSYPFTGCPDGYTIQFEDNCCGTTASPVIVDILGDGFHMTDAAGGVEFDFWGSGNPVRLSWTVANADDAWLFFDRNGNGVVDSGRELFGNITAQSRTRDPNGFVALAEFDKPRQGGNLDGMIDDSDWVFPWLRLWRDSNHNGVSEPSELFALGQLGIESLELDYRESWRIDTHGNEFRYRAKVRDSNKAHVNRWAYDVFLVQAH